jgi:hypothetical protein
MQRADGSVRRDDLMQHSRGNNFRFVAPAVLEASGIEQALWLDGDTCVSDAKAVQEWLEHTTSAPLTVAQRHVGVHVTADINFNDPLVAAWLGKDPHGSGKYYKTYNSYNAGVLLFRVDRPEIHNMIHRMETLLNAAIARRSAGGKPLWTNSVNQAVTIVSMYNYTKFVNYGFNCRWDVRWDVQHPWDEDPVTCKIKHFSKCWQ